MENACWIILALTSIYLAVMARVREVLFLRLFLLAFAYFCLEQAMDQPVWRLFWFGWVGL